MSDNSPSKNLIIAEVGSVHDGSFGNACKLIEAAARCGANVVKFQTHIAEAETLKDAPSPAFFSSEPRFDYFIRTSFTKAQWRQLAQVCADNGVAFLSSPFSLEAVDLLESVEVDSYKIASGEVTNIPLLEYIAKTRKPVYLSSGMSSWEELDRAVRVFQGYCDLCVMQCTSAYPSPPERIGLNLISEIERRYNCQVGFSDHSKGCAAAFAAAALGANVIEKHFTFSKLMYGSDALNGMEPAAFQSFCSGLLEIWLMLESPVEKEISEEIAGMKRIFEKSIVTARALSPGEIFSWKHLAFKKPGVGIPAAKFRDVIGCRARKSLPQDHILSADDFE